MNKLPSNSLQNVDFKKSTFCLSVRQYQSGTYSSLILTKNGVLYGKGKNTFGELGISSNEPQNDWVPILFPYAIDQISLIQTHTMMISRGQVYCFGSNNYGELVQSK